MNLSPCMRCTRVANPEDCENKTCKAWRSWFISRWDAMRRGVRRDMEAVQPQPAGVQVGANCYAAPHQVMGYLKSDPCESCLCPRDLCVTACPVKKNWLNACKIAGVEGK